MDARLRSLERQALSDPEARLRLVAEQQRLGYQEKQETVMNGIPLSYTTLDEFNTLIHETITSKHRETYHRFALSFTGESNCEIEYDYYGDSPHCSGEDPDVTVSIYGIRLETEKEMKKREKDIKDREDAIKKQQRADRQRRKKEKDARDQNDRQNYERLKRKFEAEDKIEQLLSSLGEEAEASLREYSPGYFKSWFHRKFKKLDNKTPMQVFDEGETEKLRLFALKAL
jgi:hypothetical protein